MKSLKKFYNIAIIFVLPVFLSGCANLISTKTSTVKWR